MTEKRSQKRQKVKEIIAKAVILTEKKPRQENQKHEIRKRKGKEIEKERKKRKQGNAISS